MGKALKKKYGKQLAGLPFVLPAFIILFAISIFPLLYELKFSFTSWELTTSAKAHFVGFKNYGTILFKDKRFWSAMKVTLILMVLGVSIELGIGTLLALLLNKLRRSRTLFVSLFIIPVMIAPIVAGFQFRMIYNDQFGPLNYLLEIITFGKWRGMAWIANPKVALYSILFTDVWQWTPFLLLIVLAGFQSIPIEFNEAAKVDGANNWNIFWKITVPLTIPFIVIGILIRVMDSFKLFDIIYILTRGGPGNVTETISFYTYLEGFEFFRVGYTAAMAFIQLIFIIIIAQLFLKFQKRMQGES